LIDPISQLLRDRAAARDLDDPCANLCTLANVDAHGEAQARTLVLRELDERLAVFVNTTSPKWEALRAGPVTLVLWLPSVQLQYRLRCETEEIPQALVHDSWHARPEPPKRLDWFYTEIQPQSSAVADRQALLEALAGHRPPEPLSAPLTAHGVYLEASRVERLQLGTEDGIHDRQLFERHGAHWRVQTLVP
jgi:pyridoxine/pyridoxamine 5'-phosphate oxidase